MSVTWARVGDVFTRSRVAIDIDTALGYRYIGVRSFGKGLIRYEETPADQLSKMKYFRLKPGALVISNIKAWEGAVSVSEPGDEILIVSNRFHTYLPSPDVDLRYALHYFTSSRGIAALSAASPGSADRNRTLRVAAFENLTIPLPDLPEQRRIAARLDAVARTSTAATNPLRQDGLRNQILSTATAGARQVRLGGVTTRRTDSLAVDPETTYRMLGLLNRGRGLFEREVMLGSETSYSCLTELHAGDLVYSKLFGWEGSVAIVDREGFVSHEFPTYTLDPEAIDKEYLRQIIRSAVFVKQLSEATTGMGQRRQRVQPDRFESALFPLPDLPEQRRIGELLGRLDEVDRLRAYRATLAAALLPAASNEEFSRLLAGVPAQ